MNDLVVVFARVRLEVRGRRPDHAVLDSSRQDYTDQL